MMLLKEWNLREKQENLIYKMKNIRNRAEFLKEAKELGYDKFKDLIGTFMENADIKTGSFDDNRYFKENGEKDIKQLKDFFRVFGYNLDELMRKYKQEIMKDDFFVANCGFLDYLLYTYDKTYELGGGFGRNEPSDTVVRYFYGYQNYNLGKIFIKQQFGTFQKFYRECAEVLPYYLFTYQQIGNGGIENYDKNSTVLDKGSFFVSFIHLKGMNWQAEFMSYEAFINEIKDNVKDINYKIVNDNLLAGFGENINLDKVSQKEIEQEEEIIFMRTTMKKYNL